MIFGQVSGQAANYIRAIQRMWGTNQSVLGQLSNEVLPIFPFDPASWPEILALAGIRLCGGASFQAAGAAGTFAKAALVNPAGSGILCIVDKISLDVPVTTLVDIRAITPNTTTLAYPTVFSTAIRDLRWQLASSTLAARPVCDIRVTADAGSGDGYLIGQVEVVGAQAAPCWTDPIILPPDCSVIVRTQDDASANTCSFVFRERAAQPEELKIG